MTVGRLADIEAGKIDSVITYKVDRLSRSLLDFARIIGIFEKHHVSFVSITQQFNSATSMGRLVLNVLLDFIPTAGLVWCHKCDKVFSPSGIPAPEPEKAEESNGELNVDDDYC